MPLRLDGVLWQLVLITIQMLSPCMSVHVHMCETTLSLRGH